MRTKNFFFTVFNAHHFFAKLSSRHHWQCMCKILIPLDRAKNAEGSCVLRLRGPACPPCPYSNLFDTFLHAMTEYVCGGGWGECKLNRKKNGKMTIIVAGAGKLLTTLTLQLKKMNETSLGQYECAKKLGSLVSFGHTPQRRRIASMPVDRWGCM